MSLVSQIATIRGSMNHDNAPMYVRTEQGQVVERVNLRVNGRDGNNLVNKKLKGNVLYGINLPLGANKVIGWCNDYANDSIVYFVYNSLTHHSIMRYYINEKRIEKIWYSESGLGFEDEVIKAVVVDGSLYWINGSQQPKTFEIERAVNYTALFDGVDNDPKYTYLDKPFAENIFPLIKRPPRFAPDCEYGSDPLIDYNNLRKHQFQFKYCYEYRNFQRSAWSPISKIPLPESELLISGKWINDISINNNIKLTFDTGSHQVSRILIAARDSNPYNSGSFFIFEEIDKYDSDGVQLIVDNISFDVLFYNNKRSESINTEVENRYCDHVPIDADDILLLANKWLAMARPLDGYDQVPVSYKLTPRESEELDMDYGEIPFPKVQAADVAGIVNCGSTPRTITAAFIVPLQFWPDAIYSITIPWGAGGIYTYTATYIAPKTQPPNFTTLIRDALYEKLAAWFNGCDEPFNRIHIVKDGIPNNQIHVWYFQTSGTPSGSGTIITNPSLSAYKSFKRGHYHPFGIIYNDGFGRYNVVAVDKENNEFFSPVADETGVNKYVQCDWEISNTPPEWATTYRWCYIKNKTYTSFIYVPNVQVIRSTDATIPSGYILLRINKAILEMRDITPNSMLATYIWQNGDRIRVPGQDKSYEVLKEFLPVENDFTPEDKEYAYHIGFLIEEEFFPLAGGGVDILPLVEVYRPNPSPQDVVYQEIGEEFAIVDGKHMGQTQDQTSVLPATGTFDFGDVYFRERIGSDAVVVMVEDANLSDYYESNSIDIGRTGARLDVNESKQKKLNHIVRSENYLEKTAYNLLNVWLPIPLADRFECSDIWGDIIGMQEVGDVLKVIQEHKETSIYIGKILAKEADGRDMYLDSGRVFGTVYPSLEFRGSKYIRSIVNNNRSLYYFDESTGEFVRSSANGQLPASSKYWMQSYFERKAKELREFEGHKDVIVCADNDYNEVLVSFIIGNTIETIVFSEEEDDKGWDYFVTYKTNTGFPENFAFQGDTVLSFLNGQLYLHNEGALNVFYGVQHPCSVKAVINTPATISKRFANIRINSDMNIWDVDFETQDMVNYGVQKSILKPSLIREMNGRLHSSILRNIIKRNGIEDISLLHNGHGLVGENMFVTLKNSDNKDVVLGEIEVKFHVNR